MDKKRLLLNILKKSNVPVTSKQLAKELGCTTRTIINYVNQINANQGKNVIKSSQDGYKLYDLTEEIDEKNLIPQDKRERMFYILKRLLLSNEKGLDIFDLADEIGISYSLLKKEISEFNTALESFNIAIMSRQNLMYIDGKERDKRKAMTAFIHKMQGDNFLDINKLENYFSVELISNIKSIIKDNVERFNAHINDFSMLNLILHLSIITHRLRAGESLQEKIPNESLSISNNISDHIIREVEARFKILLDKTEYVQMTALINAHIHFDSYRNDTIENVLTDNEIFSYIQNLMNEVKKFYYLDFTDENFLVPFTLHIQNLLVRLGNNIQIENPIKNTIRDTAPFLYDVAIYIMQSINNKYCFEKEISDNEFTFIVMHLALEVERQKNNDNCVKALLFLPKYLGIEKDLPIKLQNHFDSFFQIVAIVNFEEDIKKYDYDVLISFVNVEFQANKKFVRINPILSQSDYANLSDVFTLIQQEKLIRNFKNTFLFYFEKANFFIEHQPMDKYKAIHRISQNLIKTGYVTEEFEKNVIDRENAMSTGYLDFAVPHSVSKSVLTQTVSVMISPDGLDWDNKKIHCVILMAINPENLEQFQSMYNALLLILLETDCVDRMRYVNNFDEFRNLMLSMEITP